MPTSDRARSTVGAPATVYRTATMHPPRSAVRHSQNERGSGIMRSVIDAPRLGRRGELRHRDYASQFVAPGLVFLRRTLA